MYESQIKRFRQEDALSFPPPDVNLFVGSSSIRRWETLCEDMLPKQVINRGFGGSDMKSLALLYDDLVKPYCFSKIFVYEGDNDLNSRKRSPQSVLDIFAEIVEKIHRQCPDAQINFISIKYSPARQRFMRKYKEANALFEEFCKTQPYLNFIDIASKMLNSEGLPDPPLFESADRIHPSAEGYKVLTLVLKPHLHPAVRHCD